MFYHRNKFISKAKSVTCRTHRISLEVLFRYTFYMLLHLIKKEVLKFPIFFPLLDDVKWYFCIENWYPFGVKYYFYQMAHFNAPFLEQQCGPQFTRFRKNWRRGELNRRIEYNVITQSRLTVGHWFATTDFSNFQCQLHFDILRARIDSIANRAEPCVPGLLKNMFKLYSLTMRSKNRLSNAVINGKGGW